MPIICINTVKVLFLVTLQTDRNVSRPPRPVETKHYEDETVQQSQPRQTKKRRRKRRQAPSADNQAFNIDEPGSPGNQINMLANGYVSTMGKASSMLYEHTLRIYALSGKKCVLISCSHQLCIVVTIKMKFNFCWRVQSMLNSKQAQNANGAK